MEQDQNIVNRVKNEFLKRMHGDLELSAIADEVGELITKNEKPKAEQFVNIYQSISAKECKAE